VDRLIALVRLSWKIELRGLLRARARLVGLLLAVPVLAFVSLMTTLLILVGLPILEARAPGAVAAVLSAVATAFGLMWTLSPLLTGHALTEAHDVSRLLHFPVPARTLLLASFLANLLQPIVLAVLPPLAALSYLTARGLHRLPLTIVGVGLSFAFILAASQVVGLVLHAMARNRRLQDRLLVAGLFLGFLVGFLPLLLVTGGGDALTGLVSRLVSWDVFVFSPFGWGVRAAVHGGRGEGLAFFVHFTWAALAVAFAFAAAAALLQRVYHGELVLGTPRPAQIPARMVLAGRIGALLEKELRNAWRDPALKASVVTGLLGPLLVLLLLSQGPLGPGAGTILTLASFIGLSTFGANTFGAERRALSLLLSFPAPRWQILLAKNLAVLLLRAPSLLALLVAGSLVASPAWLPAAATIALATQLVGLGVDNFVAVRMPVPVPEAGKNPYAGAGAGASGLGAVAILSVCLVAVLVLASPFVFLAWLPLLLGQPWLWLATLPLALAGAASVYGMLVAGAGRYLGRREPELVERVLVEA
jgi:ABC-2 type transport system permease protein